MILVPVAMECWLWKIQTHLIETFLRGNAGKVWQMHCKRQPVLQQVNKTGTNYFSNDKDLNSIGCL